MRLVHTDTGIEVKVGDHVKVSDKSANVTYFREPHKPASEGQMTIRFDKSKTESTYYVSVCGCEWVEREDRLSDRKFTPAEIEFFAVACTISNMGHGADRWVVDAEGFGTTKLQNWQNKVRVNLRDMRGGTGSLRQYIDAIDQEVAAEGGASHDGELIMWRNNLRKDTIYNFGTKHKDFLPLLCWLDERPCSMVFGKGEFTQAEREGLVWLADRAGWCEMNIGRNSDREFDLKLDGVTWLDKRVGTTYRMTAWFVMACVHEFWAMGKIENPTGDWSFLRDREREVQWADFHAVLRGAKPTGVIAEGYRVTIA